MARTSPCALCGLMQGCVFRGERQPGCAEYPTPPKEKTMAVQQYSTPDGSIWETTNEDDHNLIRVGSPDGSHEDDAHGQHLAKVIRFWGPLSLYDPYAEELRLITEIVNNAHNISHPATYAERIQKELRRLGLKLVKETDDD